MRRNHPGLLPPLLLSRVFLLRHRP